MDKRFLWTVLAVTIVTAGAVALATLPEPAEAEALHETVSGVEVQPSSSVPEPESQPEYAYILREYQGRVAVYSATDPDTPEMILDTLVNYLPDYDRSQIQQGIKVKDYKELVALIEDFVS